MLSHGPGTLVAKWACKAHSLQWVHGLLAVPLGTQCPRFLHLTLLRPEYASCPGRMVPVMLDLRAFAWALVPW